jgi:hypothetical protein
MPALTSHQFMGYAVKKPQAMANCIMNQNSIRVGEIGPNQTKMTNAIQPYISTCQAESDRKSTFKARRQMRGRIAATWETGPIQVPDFTACAKKILGNRVLPNAVLELRR